VEGGRKRTFYDELAMSALPPNAHIRGYGWNVS
jgi:hypothetical protein